MSKRSAESSIKGYTYQFLHTVLDILDQEDSTVNIVEGIEDLDIHSLDTTELYQYKYHELQNFKKSLVGKPIGLMFNHFLNNANLQYSYKLILYISESIPSFDKLLLWDVLQLKASQDYISDENKKFCTNKIKIQMFLDKFTCVSAVKIYELEEKTIVKLVEIFSVSREEAQLNLLPNAFKEIVEYGTKMHIDERKVTTGSFKQSLQNKKDIADIAFMARIHGEDKAIKTLKRRKEAVGVKRNNSDHIIFLSGKERYQLASLVLDIAKKFYYKGNKQDYKPVIFVIDEMEDLKISLIAAMKVCNEVILFNDGYEEYGFFHEVFNQVCMTTGKPNRGKVNDANFNFKLISLETYKSNKNNIKFINPTVFCIDIPPQTFISGFERTYYINTLSNENIVSVIGG